MKPLNSDLQQECNNLIERTQNIEKRSEAEHHLNDLQNHHHQKNIHKLKEYIYEHNQSYSRHGYETCIFNLEIEGRCTRRTQQNVKLTPFPLFEFGLDR